MERMTFRESMTRPVPRVWFLVGALVFVLTILNGLHRDGLLGEPKAARATQREILDRQDRIVEDVRSRTLSELEQEGHVSDQTRDAAFEELDRHMVKAEAETPKDAGIWRVQRRWLAGVKGMTDTVFAAYARFEEQPHIGDFRFESVEELDAVIAVASECETQATNFEAYTRETPERLSVMLREEGIGEATARVFVKGATTLLATNIKVRELERESWKGARQQMELLRNQWGHWSVSANGAIRFEDADVDAAFWALQRRIEATRAESLELVKEAMKQHR